jgi:WhiB family redox-sensing transcriptional regulator
VEVAELLVAEALLLGYDPTELSDLVVRPAWMRDALCREYPEVNFFPQRGQAAEPAKVVCARCIVCGECADFIASMDSGVASHGIWAGTSARQRRGRPREDDLRSDA